MKMDFRKICFVFGIIIISILPTHLSLAQDNNKNYDTNKQQNQLNRGNQNGTNPLAQFFNFVKNFFSNNGSTAIIGNTNATTSKSITERFNDFTNAIKGAFLSLPVQQAIQTGGTVADAFLQDYLKGYGVSEACYDDLKEMGQGIVQWTDWAQRMLDAFGKPNTGLKAYQFKWLGDYDECIATKATDYYPTTEGWKPGPVKFSGRYCAVNIPLKIENLPIQPEIVIGTCMPDSCVSTDIHAMLIAAIEFAKGNKTDEDVLEVNCQDEERPLDTPAIVAICILGILGIFVVFGTLYDIVAIQMHRSSNDKEETHKQPPNTFRKTGVQNGGYLPEPEISKVALPDEDKTVSNGGGAVSESALVVEDVKVDVSPPKPSTEERSRGVIEKVLLSFSVYSNGVKILNTNQSAGSLGAVNGIRFLSMAWVILGHTIFFAIGYDENIFGYYLEQLNMWHFMGIIYASVSVDTFFALSGLLVAYLTLRELKKVRGICHFNWGLFYFHRLWRLTPAYMLVIMVFTCLMKYWGSGPMWPTDRVLYDNCREAWWTNLLYVNNYVNTDKSCMGWTWYLANDMQFYIISPLILIPLFYQVVVGGLVSLVFLAASVVATGIIAMNHHYPIQQGPYATKADDEDYGNLLYIPSYARMGPYVIGLFTGYLLYRMKCKCRMPKTVVLIGWLLTFAICAAVVYGPYSDKDSHVMHDTENSVYHALHRTGWSIAICWIVFACATGHGGWINEMLSWKPFIPLGRLTYCAYLIHPIVELNYNMSRRRLIFFNSYEVAYMFLANLVVSYGMAFLVSLAFESPMMGLEKALLKRDRRS